MSAKATRLSKRGRELSSSPEIELVSVSTKKQRKEPQIPTPALALSAAVDAPNASLQQYKKALPNNAEGIAFLFGSRLSSALSAPAERVALVYNVTKEAAIEEFRRLIAIKVFTNDEHADKISPTPIMDEIWHAAILDTQFYADLQGALGVVLHHRPSGASEEEFESRQSRLTVMKNIYTTFFLTKPIEIAPFQAAQVPFTHALPSNQFRFNVITPSNLIREFKASKTTKVYRVMQELEKMEGIPVVAQRLFYHERFGMQQLDRRQTLGHYGIGHETELELLREQSGC